MPPLEFGQKHDRNTENIVPVSSIISASNFLGALGVDTHIGYTDGGYANIQNVISDLKQIGITQVRDGISNSTDYNGVYNGSAPISSYIAMAQAGIKFTIVMEVTNTAQFQYEIGLVKQLLAAVPGSVVALEGPNEINNEPITYNGVGGIQGAINLQQDIYNATRTTPALTGLAVDYFTGYAAGSVPAGPDPVAAGITDYDNQHPYPNYGQAPNAWVSRVNALPNAVNPATEPAVYTETGYSSNQVGTDIQAKYTLDLLMDTASEDISRTYLYDLLDGYAPGSSQGNDGFGLFSYTTAPKPVAIALHNLTTLLQDTGTGAATYTPATLAYTLAGLPSTGNSIVIGKSDGSDIIAVWAEPQIYNSTSGAEISVPTNQVTVNLSKSYSSVQVFDPLVGTAAIATYTNVSSISVGVSDHPILIDVSQTVTPPVTSGPDTLILNVAEITAGGKDAQFTVSVDGVQVGGVQTVTAQETAYAGQNIALTGKFGAGSHTVTVTYLNGFTGAAADAGRTLYVNAVTLNNSTTFTNSILSSNGNTSYTVQPAVASNAGTADTLILNVSETAVNGKDAAFMVSVDGQLVSGVTTATASHATGASQNVVLTGNFGSGQHIVTVDLLDGFAGQTADVGRALYVNSITLDGATTTTNAAQTYLGAQNYMVLSGTTSMPPPVTAPALTITLSSQVLTQDTGASSSDDVTNNGAVKLTGGVTGPSGTKVQVVDGGTVLGTATISGGNWSYSTILGSGSHTLHAVANAPSGGAATSSTGGTILVDTAPPVITISTPTEVAGASTAAVTIAGKVTDTLVTSVELFNGSKDLGSATVAEGSYSFTANLGAGSYVFKAIATDLAGNTASASAAAFTVTTTPPVPSGSGTLVLNVAETATNGQDAQFVVSVDGLQVGGVQTVTAAESAGASQNIALTGNFGTGSHTVTVTFVNSGFSGSAANVGRTLYVNAITLNNSTTFANSYTIYSGNMNYTLNSAVASNAGTQDKLVLNVSETPVSGKDAQFMVSVDGQLVSGVLIATASHATGASQNITLTGNFGSGQHAVTVDLLDGFAGQAADAGRTLYVNAITLDGKTTTQNSQQTYIGAQTYTVTAGTTAPAPTIAAASAIAPTVAATTTGTSHDDFLSGNARSNTLIGKGGNDTYIMEANDKTDTIINGTTGSNTASEQLDILAAPHSQGQFAQSGSNVLGTGQEAVLQNWLGSDSATLHEIVAANGYKIDTNAQLLVQAITAFSAAHNGFDATSLSQLPDNTALHTTLTVSWHK